MPGKSTLRDILRTCGVFRLTMDIGLFESGAPTCQLCLHNLDLQARQRARIKAKQSTAGAPTFLWVPRPKEVTLAVGKARAVPSMVPTSKAFPVERDLECPLQTCRLQNRCCLFHPPS